MRRTVFLALALAACAPTIEVAKPDVTINPPAALMQPPVPLVPFLWTDPEKPPQIS